MGPTSLKVRGPAIAKALKSGDHGEVTFGVSDGLKDLRAMLAEGKERGLAMPLVENTLACYQEVVDKGLGAHEVSTVSVYWSKRDAE